MVLFEVWQSPDLTVREISERARITERATHRILATLVANGYLQRNRIGRRNHYVVSPDAKFRHPAIAHLPINDLLKILARPHQS